MKKVISIGINNAKGLTPLVAAVSGANEFNDWAKSQGYETVLFTDENSKPVKQNKIFDEISNSIQSKKYEQLIIFFSGHGVLKSPSQEAWILTDAKSNPNESINLTGSIDNARTSGIPYIVFISDACRILPSEMQLSGNGSVIFPIIDDTNQDSYIDVFYAARPGSPANEINSKESSKRYGIFTESLLEVLKGKYPDLLWSKVASGGYLTIFYDITQLKNNIHYKALPLGNSWELHSTNFENPLKSIVNQKANAINITLNQNPDIRIQFQKDQPSLSIFEDNAAKELLINSSNKIINGVDAESEIHEGIQENIEFGVRPIVENNPSFASILQNIRPITRSTPAYDLDSKLIKTSEKIFESKGRESFETQTGFTIIGNQIADVIVKDSRRDIFTENNIIHIRINADDSILSALFVLKNGQSIPLAVLKGYIGTLVFDEDRLLTVNYTPSRNNYKFYDFQRHEKEINFVRAFVASSANEGFDYQKTFEREFNKDGYFDYYDSGNFLRREKSLDPSLGLYAVYAYRQAGKFKDIQSVFRYMDNENDNMLFDVAMLSNKLEESHNKIAPFCPMLSLGWAYQQHFIEKLSSTVQSASQYLIPNLWTTFGSEGTDSLINAMKNNQLK